MNHLIFTIASPDFDVHKKEKNKIFYKKLNILK